jgi:hypothetical protein
VKPEVKYDPEIALRTVVTGYAIGFLLARAGNLDEIMIGSISSLILFAYDYAAVSIKTWLAKRKGPQE